MGEVREDRLGGTVGRMDAPSIFHPHSSPPYHPLSLSPSQPLSLSPSYPLTLSHPLSPHLIQCRTVVASCQPNQGHVSLAQLELRCEAEGKPFALLTQVRPVAPPRKVLRAHV